ncbi:hypothetical protein CROQUDRAFT_88266 [Cronartium quercuum f. sp. fusiforme G11]|uniref:Uncharacterized protein n=1 Tax=Cronartium quercuum f. sp. fusiforme G11 TaxID=708437 RepID=A0A9P6TFR6_9BASI|nr:hypothetical protein CROQUDRAFT_88266 [Cronartium quercuum f. sp. fusiforme G11]
MGRSLVTAANFVATLLALVIVCIRLFDRVSLWSTLNAQAHNLLELNVPTALRRHKLAPGSQVWS